MVMVDRLSITRVEIKTQVSKHNLMRAFQEFFDDENFDPACWSVYEAELFEMVARKIRDYYNRL